MAWQYRPGACSTGRRSPAAAVGVVVAATEAQSPLIEPIACRHYPATHPTSPHRQAPTCLPHDESPQCRWKQSLACVERLMQANTTMRRSHHDCHIGAPQAIKLVSHLARAQSTRQMPPSCRIAECSVRVRRQVSPQDHAVHTTLTHTRTHAVMRTSFEPRLTSTRPSSECTLRRTASKLVRECEYDSRWRSNWAIEPSILARAHTPCDESGNRSG